MNTVLYAYYKYIYIAILLCCVCIVPVGNVCVNLFTLHVRLNYNQAHVVHGYVRQADSKDG